MSFNTFLVICQPKSNLFYTLILSWDKTEEKSNWEWTQTVNSSVEHKKYHSVDTVCDNTKYGSEKLKGI